MTLTIIFAGTVLVVWIVPETHERQMEIKKINQNFHDVTWLLNDDEIGMKIYRLTYDAIEAYKSDPDYFEYDERRKA